MISKIAILLATVAGVNAACDNQCSGHGSCMVDDVCKCYDNWGVGLSLDSGDCSDRVCPFEISWVDEPNASGDFHKYAECAGKGVCNRASGLCECFDGYEGKACHRASCPNDCSGHGTCEYVEDLAFGSVWNQGNSEELKIYSQTFNYYGWDKSKTRSCVCDAQYTDIDCSKRMCPHGNDVTALHTDVSSSANQQIQHIVLTDDGFHGGDSIDYHETQTFSLRFTSRLNETFDTIPIVFDYKSGHQQVADSVEKALTNLPNRIIDECDVEVTLNAGTSTTLKITFTGDAVQGRQNLLEVLDDQCEEGCTPRLTGIAVSTAVSSYSTVDENIASEENSYECGRRGKCDYDTGLCACFEGYTGENCGTQTTLV